MSIKLRLTVLSFLQFFIWGAYLTSLGGYMYSTLGFKGEQIGKVYLTLGIGSILMPGILGIIADRYMNSERLLGICHLFGGGFLFYASTTHTPGAMFGAMLLVCLAYMPTIALNNTVSYTILKNNALNPQKRFPANSGLGHNRFHLCDVVCRPDALDTKPLPVDFCWMCECAHGDL
jgi:NHS family xanthosine MFS transporter